LSRSSWRQRRHPRCPAGSFYVDLSTSSPTLIRRIYGVLKERGVKVADAPVSGGVIGAEEASLQIMVGSDPDVFEQIKPALLGIGDKVAYIGEVGAGEVAKLVHNQIALVVQQLSPKAHPGTKAGIAPEKLLEAIRGGAYGRSNGSVGSSMENIILQGGWDAPRFALALARKDLGLATDLASEFGVPCPGGRRRAEPDRMPEPWLGRQGHDRRLGASGRPRHVQVRSTQAAATP